ncbi:MAG: class I SAM-dependent methyltransferase [Gallionella sp.]
MNQVDSQKDYWAEFWSNNDRLKHDDLYYQVGHTANGMPIDPQRWQFTLNQIERTIKLAPSDSLLDLCAGNGLIAAPFSQKCKAVTVVDYSEALLKRIDTNLYPNITVLHADARDVSLPKEAFSKGIMYGALQHFNEREAVSIFQTIYQSMQQDGLFLVGDIPDIDRLFTFYNKPEWVKAYFDSIKNNAPAVGTWYKKEILVEMAKYAGFNNAETCNQDPSLLNSHYRFDLLLAK